MPNLATVLREEIRRLARKETKVLVNSTRKATTQHRRDIAELKRTVAALQKEVVFLRKMEASRGGKLKIENTELEGTRFSSKSVRAQRRRLGLSRSDFGRLLGVSSQSIYNWENDESRPRSEAMEALVAIRKMGKKEAMRRLETL
jgi:DNA-binding transcriptional regulator YiaG